MKHVKFYQENGLIPVKANPTDSGFDVKSNGLVMVANSHEKFNQEFILLSKKEFYDMDEDSQYAMIHSRLVSAFIKLHLNVIYSIYMEYNTGLRTILDNFSDIKGRAKSGRSRKAPLLGGLQNGVGVIDEHYRGEILFKYELAPIIAMRLSMVPNDNINTLVNDVMKGIYLPSATNSIGQITIENREDVEVEIINSWLPEYEVTDRGIGGHDSTKS